ncbi:MAG: hypothetical protein CVT77_10435 [Alphaproteobacteria bacterium HGW-Alphaproteobacteria-16]|nr:MAG: hypothetical protein CVT77_10435 [Alphaproteobacteria bacterium HGW-Alphaproteobacteria-16]
MATATPPALDRPVPGQIAIERPALERIERAMARIEAAAANRAFDAEVLERRHAALRETVQSAIATLDQLIVQEQEEGD